MRFMRYFFLGSEYKIFLMNLGYSSVSSMVDENVEYTTCGDLEIKCQHDFYFFTLWCYMMNKVFLVCKLRAVSQRK